MENTKKWTLSVLSMVISGLVLAATLVVVIDPFFQYHKPLNNIGYAFVNGAWQSPGILKNFEYNAIIAGSSMTFDFKPSLFKKLLGVEAVKVSVGGGTAKNINLLLNIALKENAEIKTIFWGLDYNAMEVTPSQTRDPLPLYLYNDNLLNDIEYLLNKEVLISRAMLTTFFKTIKGEKTNLDYAYSSEEIYTFSQEEIISGYKEILELDKNVVNDNVARPPGGGIIKENIMGNMEQNILPLIKENPSVQFNVFFPPYSILYWHYRTTNGILDETIDELDYIMPQLLDYPNVNVYYFQNIEEIVTDLDNYNDYTHHTRAIHDYMTHCFANKKHLMTKENYKVEIEKMRTLATYFDYNKFLK